MRFILNMNVSREVGAVLSALGQEWAHARELGLATADDRSVLELAREQGRVIVTHDLDYADLLILGGEPRPSAIIFRLRVSSPGLMCWRLRQAWDRITQALEDGAIVVIEDAAVRIRSLESP